MDKSSKAISELLENGFKEGKVKGFKPHPSAFCGYRLSHERHHRGQIMLALKQSSHPVNRKVQYEPWGWGSQQTTRSTQMKTSGYSGTPLAKKLGIKSNFKIRLENQPRYYFDLFTDLPSGIRIIKDRKTKKDLIHYFTASASQLERDISALRQEIEDNGAIWISWPKKASKMKTDVNENIIRDIALKNRLVDVKVCAIDEVWSGLKLVIRLKDRQ